MGLPFELVLVDRAVKAQKSQEFIDLNPNGQVPVLKVGEVVLYETAAICLHLCDTYGDDGIAPKVGTTARADFYK